jgi:hypothetical protein
VQLAEFERAARALWSEIPAAYKEGVDGLIIEESAIAHPKHPEVYTLGECLTEDYPSQYGGPDTIRSAVVLYYGSFQAIAADDPGFDWEAELHETLMHELQHHLETLATESGLEDVDYAVDENFKRVDGEPFDPLFYRAGVQIGENVYRVEDDVFIEVFRADTHAFRFEFEFEGAHYTAEIPGHAADVLFAYVEDAPVGVADFCVVRVRERGVFATLRAALRGSHSVDETIIIAKVVS